MPSHHDCGMDAEYYFGGTPDDEPSQADLDDAIIEDTCHCQCCQASFVLGGNDYVLVEKPMADGTVAPLALCIECAEQVHKAYLEAQADAGLCLHGTCLGHPCEECLAPINLCKEVVKFFGSHEAWGDYATLGRAAVAFGPIVDQARKILDGKV